MKAIEAMNAVRESRLPPSLRLVAWAYCLAMNRQCIAWPGAKKIGRDTGLNERTVRRHRDALVDIGFLVNQNEDPDAPRKGRAPRYLIVVEPLAEWEPPFSSAGESPGPQTPKVRAIRPDCIKTEPRTNRPGGAGESPGGCGQFARRSPTDPLTDPLSIPVTEVEMSNQERVLSAWLDLWKQRHESREWGTKSGRPPGMPRGVPTKIPSQLRAALKERSSDDLILLMRWAFKSSMFDAAAMRGEAGDRRRRVVRLDLVSLFRHRDGQLDRRIGLAEQWIESGALGEQQAGSFDATGLVLSTPVDLAEWRRDVGDSDAF